MDMDGDGVISLLSDDENGISNVQHHGHQTRKRGRSNDGDCDGNNSDDDNNDSDYEEEEEEHDEIINNNSKPQKAACSTTATTAYIAIYCAQRLETL